MHVLVFPINVLHLYSCFQSSCEIFLKFLPKGKKLSISNTEKEEEEKKKDKHSSMGFCQCISDIPGNQLS